MVSLNHNPWQVDSLQAFSFLCCPECVYRSQEEASFQTHAIQNHPKSSVFFSIPSAALDCDVIIKEEMVDSVDLDQKEILDVSLMSENFKTHFKTHARSPMPNFKHMANFMNIFSVQTEK